MKIREFIIKNELKNSEERVEKLKQIRAPQIMIDKLYETIEDLKNGILKVGDKEELLDLEFNEFEVKKGRGGKIYVMFDKKINYYPNGRYGAFITKNSK